MHKCENADVGHAESRDDGDCSDESEHSELCELRRVYNFGRTLLDGCLDSRVPVTVHDYDTATCGARGPADRAGTAPPPRGGAQNPKSL